MMDVNQQILIKETRLAIIKEFVEQLDERKKVIQQDYVQIGTSDEQEISWRTKEPLWEDAECTIPRLKKIYGYVDKAELTPSDKVKIDTIDELIKDLFKMI